MATYAERHFAGILRRFPTGGAVSAPLITRRFTVDLDTQSHSAASRNDRNGEATKSSALTESQFAVDCRGFGRPCVGQKTRDLLNAGYCSTSH